MQWEEVFPCERAGIVVPLAGRVDIGTEGLNLRHGVDGLTAFEREVLARDMCAAA